MKTPLIAAAALALAAGAAHAEPNYVTIEMEIDVDTSAEHLWDVVGEDYCAIGEWGGLDCEITSGDGGMGTVRVLAGGVITEILVAQTELSYGYAQPVVEGRPYDLYHGFMEARPVTDDTSKMIYTLVYDVSHLGDQAAIDQNVSGRRAMFEGLLQRMKEMAEAG